MKKCYVLKVLSFTAGVLLIAPALQAATIAGARYNADAGYPATPAEVQSPTSQGWIATDSSLGGTDVQEGVIEGGKGAWRNRDGINNNNPGYQRFMSPIDYSEMYFNGWFMETEVRLVEGGHFVAWGGDNTNTGDSFGFPGDRRAGFSLGASGNDYIVTPTGTGGSAYTVTDGILNSQFVRIQLHGKPQTTYYSFNIYDADTDALLSAQLITAFGAGNSSTDNNVMFASGSSGGDNREAIFRSFALEHRGGIPEPDTVMLIGIGFGLISIGRKLGLVQHLA